jgi:hypothetical protein
VCPQTEPDLATDEEKKDVFQEPDSGCWRRVREHLTAHPAVPVSPFRRERVAGGDRGAFGGDGSECWAQLPPELLREVLVRIEASESWWPARKDVVLCAGVCRTWRGIMKEAMRVPEVSGKLTFPISLKQVCCPRSPSLAVLGVHCCCYYRYCAFLFHCTPS